MIGEIAGNDVGKAIKNIKTEAACIILCEEDKKCKVAMYERFKKICYKKSKITYTKGWLK